MGTAVVYIITFGIIIALGYALIRFLGKCAVRAKEQSDMKDKYNSIYYAMLKHIDGLPIIQGSLVDTFYCEDKFVFRKG